MSELCCGESATIISPNKKTTPHPPATDACGCPVETPTVSNGPEPLNLRRLLTDPTIIVPLCAGVMVALGHVVHPWFFWLALGLGCSQFAVSSLRRLVVGPKRLTIGLLMTISAVGAVLLGQIGSAAALAFLFSLAEALEHTAMTHARANLRALVGLIPQEAHIVTDAVTRTTTDEFVSSNVTSSTTPPQEVVSAATCDDTCGCSSCEVNDVQGSRPPSVSVNNETLSDIPVADLRIGDVFQVFPGERIPTDGVITHGYGAIDASAVTGESIPVEVQPGIDVPAGAIVQASALTIKAKKPGTDNTLTTIVSLVTAAQQEKGKRARMADAVAAPLIPLVLVVSLAVAVIGSLVGDPAIWITRALVVLVAASPCALAIAVPVTVIAAIGAASKAGIVITSGAAFERLGAITTVAFDKTGTLTRGEPEVIATHGAADTLAIAAAMEETSTHPLAHAIGNAAKRLSPTSPTAGGQITRPLNLTHITEEPGVGITAWEGETQWKLTNPTRVDCYEFADIIDHYQHKGATVVVLVKQDHPIGVIAIADPLREETPTVIRTLRGFGMRALMLTGDNQAAAHTIGAAAGIEEQDIYAQCYPQDKAKIAEQTSHLAMIGDGINDAPALAAADVGIAMGEKATDAAVDSADVALNANGLSGLPLALIHARRARAIMTVNIVLALLVIAVLPPLALFGVLGLTTVVLIHETAEVIIIANGLRAASLARVRRLITN